MTISKLTTWIAGGIFLFASVYLAPQDGSLSVAARRAQAVHAARSSK